VRALGWTSFFTDLSSEAIYPLLPGFVKNLGGGGEAIGLIDGAANAVAAIVRLPSGMLSDRVGRRPLVLFGYGLSAVVRPLMALAPAGSQGRSFGWYALVQGLMALPAGLLAGWLWERRAPQPPSA
jgi:MFS family permease